MKLIISFICIFCVSCSSNNNEYTEIFDIVKYDTNDIKTTISNDGNVFVINTPKLETILEEAPILLIRTNTTFKFIEHSPENNTTNYSILSPIMNVEYGIENQFTTNTFKIKIYNEIDKAIVKITVKSKYNTYLVYIISNN